MSLGALFLHPTRSYQQELNLSLSPIKQRRKHLSLRAEYALTSYVLVLTVPSLLNILSGRDDKDTKQVAHFQDRAPQEADVAQELDVHQEADTPAGPDIVANPATQEPDAPATAESDSPATSEPEAPEEPEIPPWLLPPPVPQTVGDLLKDCKRDDIYFPFLPCSRAHAWYHEKFQTLDD